MALNRDNRGPSTSALAEVDRYRAAYERDPASRVFAALSDAYRRVGMLDEAIQVARDGLGKHPRYVGGMVALGRALLESENLDEAKQQFEMVVSHSPDNLIAQRCLGDINYHNGNREQSLKAYRVILDLNPNDEQIKHKVEELEQTAQATPLQETSEPEPQEPIKSVDEFWGSNVGPQPMQEQPEDDIQPETTEKGEDTIELEAQEGLELNLPRATDANQSELKQIDVFFQGVDLNSKAEGQQSMEYEVKKAEEAIPEEQPREQAQNRNTITTETMATLYLKQGFKDRALKIYNEILALNPGRKDIADKAKQLAGELGIEFGEPLEPEPVEQPQALPRDEQTEPKVPWEDEVSSEIEMPTPAEKPEDQQLVAPAPSEQQLTEQEGQPDEVIELPITHAESIGHQAQHEQDEEDEKLTPEQRRAKKLRSYLNKIKKQRSEP